MSNRTVVDITDVGLHFLPGTRVLLDGEDVSNRCYRAEVYDDGTGAAYCYKWRKGKPYYDKESDDVAKETLTGKVEIIRPA